MPGVSRHMASHTGGQVAVSARSRGTASRVTAAKKTPATLVESRGPILSGRLDLNQRPLAPQRSSVESHGVTQDGMASHPSESTGDGRKPPTHPVVPIAYRATEVPAPVLRPGERFLTPAEVAGLLQVSRATVYGLIGRGLLRAVRVGLQLRVAPLEVERWRS
jgi:excisionase family DNA binding protein